MSQLTYIFSLHMHLIHCTNMPQTGKQTRLQPACGTISIQPCLYLTITPMVPHAISNTSTSTPHSDCPGYVFPLSKAMQLTPHGATCWACTGMYIATTGWYKWPTYCMDHMPTPDMCVLCVLCCRGLSKIVEWSLTERFYE